MSEYLVKGETLTAIADAVRAKTGETDKLSLGAMADAITALDTNGINFKIIGGTTQPGGSNVGSGTNNIDEEDPTVESIEENTIWINTDSEITSWVISKIKPSSPVKGMLWIYPEAPSQIKLNIANEIGAVETFPRLAYQYIGTKWVAKTAYSYINSEWRDWYYRLLTYTDQHTDVTGGWLLRPANGSTGTSVSGVSKTDTTGVGIAIKHTATNAFTSANLVTKKAIDLTDISKITFVITDYATNASASSQVQLMVHGKSYGTNASNAQYKVTKIISKNGTYTIDVSDLSGEYYVRLYSNTGVKTTTLQFTVSQVYCTWITP